MRLNARLISVEEIWRRRHVGQRKRNEPVCPIRDCSARRYADQQS